MPYDYVGPKCQVYKWFSDENDSGTIALTANQPPVPTGHRKKHHRKRPKPPLKKPDIPTVVFDYDMVVGFLRAVARSKVLVRHVTVSWDETKEPGWGERFLFWKDSKLAGTERKPGIMTVSWGDESKIYEQTADAERELHELFVQRLKKSPWSAYKFMEEQEKARERNLETIKSAYAEVTNANAELRDNLAWHIAPLSAIKCSATITFKVVGFLAEGVAAFFVDLGYDVTVSVVTEFDGVMDAKLALVAAKEAAIDTEREVLGKVADKLGHEKDMHKIADKLAAKIDKEMLEKYAASRPGVDAIKDLYEGLLKTTTDETERKIIAGSIRRLEAHAATRLSRGLVKGLRRGLPHAIKGIFAVWDIGKAIDQAHKEFREL